MYSGGLGRKTPGYPIMHLFAVSFVVSEKLSESVFIFHNGMPAEELIGGLEKGHALGEQR